VVDVGWLIVALVACSAPKETAPVDTGVPIPRGALQLGFPVPDRDAIATLVGVDHDPVVQSSGIGGLVCTDYEGRGFPHCYDEHDGSDYMLDGGFDAMDAGSAVVVAAAGGVVVATEDGHYDRCHADLSDPSGVSCDGNDGVANSVTIEHEGGYRTLYWHLMNGSVAVAVGASVGCGDPVGVIGSSGYSSAPHLHFELQDPDGVVIDPYAGVASQPETWWEEQGEVDALPGAGCAG
jgi:murein DD-endopeptidase MepM/ murein hydrolase activator NlpD